MYIKGHVKTVNTNIKAMLLCIEYSILFVDTVDMKIKACNALNAMFVETVNTKHDHTFLLITFLIFNRFSIKKKSFGKLRLRAFQPYHQYYMSRYLHLPIW